MLVNMEGCQVKLADVKAIHGLISAEALGSS